VTRIAFDTNILVYLAGISRAPSDTAKIEKALNLHSVLAESCTCVAPLQVFGELYVVLHRARGDRVQAREIVLAFQEQFEPVSINVASFSEALRLATDHKLQFWDALILNAAADAGCALLLSEDMQAGFAWRGVTVADPFAAEQNPLLAKLTRG
jgi:predicted nucleic acid-binding protein